MRPNSLLRSVLRGLLALTIAISLFTSCRPASKTRPVLVADDGTVIEAPDAPSQTEEQQAQALLDEAGRAVAPADREAIGAQLLSRFPATEAAANLRLKRLQSIDPDTDPETATQLCKEILFYRPSFSRISEVKLVYAELLAKEQAWGQVADLLLPVYEETAESKAKADIGLKLAEAYAQDSRMDRALEIQVRLLESGSFDPAQRNQVRESVLLLAKQHLSASAAEALWKSHRKDSDWRFVMPIVGYKYGKTRCHVRAYDDCRDILDEVAERFGSTEYAPKARDYLSHLADRTRVEPKHIGVLLPLSGRFRVYGERAQAAIEMAVAGSGLILKIRDTQGDPTLAARRVRELVLEDHVVAIIGPMFSKEATAAALAAERLEVPILSLSHTENLTEIGPHVFRTALTVESQARSLAKTAFEDLGMSRFALLYPRSRYGQTFAEAFWDEVESRKGEIRGAETYEHNATTFISPVKKLVGRYYVFSRPEYRDAFYSYKAKRLPSHRFNEALERKRKGLHPVVDFDAIVIPDSAKNLGLVAPALAFEDIVTEKDPKIVDKIKKSTGNKNVTPVTLLGGSTWNSPRVLQTCDKYCEGAIFVDGYFPDSPNPRVRKFAAGFQERMKAVPQLSEAQAFDSAGLLASLLKSKFKVNRAQLADALRTMPVYQGVTGQLRFDEQGEVVRTLQTMTISDGTITRYPAKSKGEG